MNQTLWIVGGGILVVIIAGALYVMSGDGLPKDKKIVTPTTQKTNESQAQVAVDAYATASPVKVTKSGAAEAPKVATPQSKGLYVLHTNVGDITIKLYESEAPKASDNFKQLAMKGFYDGVKFHRVIKGFMIQSGDPLSKDNNMMARWGTGGPGYTFENEATSHKFVRGSLGMANSGGTHTNGSQFFVVTAPSTPFLDGGYTNFGEVVDGLDIALKIEGVETDGSAQLGTGNDRPLEAVVIKSVEAK